MTTRRSESLTALVEQIVRIARPLRVLLFGSAARGDASGSSDLDLLVVVPDGTHRRHTAQRLYAGIVGVPVGFDLVVATESDLRRHAENRSLVYRAALRDGRPVYVAPVA